jgi:hypothetical protein
MKDRVDKSMGIVTLIGGGFGFFFSRGKGSAKNQIPLAPRAFSSQIKSKVGNILVKTTTLRIALNIDGSPIASTSHTPSTSLSQ